MLWQRNAITTGSFPVGNRNFSETGLHGRLPNQERIICTIRVQIYVRAGAISQITINGTGWQQHMLWIIGRSEVL
jgi:hypothetical protein